MPASMADPAEFAEAVTPSDTTNFTGGAARALYIGAAGTAVVVLKSGAAVTFVGLAAGSILPVECKRVNETGTTADMSIVALR